MIGFIKVICSGKIGEIYNVGNNKEEISMNSLAKIILKIYNNKKIKIKNVNYPNTYPSNEPLRRCPNIEKITMDTGFKPKIGIIESLRYFIKYY